MNLDDCTHFLWHLLILKILLSFYLQCFVLIAKRKKNNDFFIPSFPKLVEIAASERVFLLYDKSLHLWWRRDELHVFLIPLGNLCEWWMLDMRVFTSRITISTIINNL